MKKFIFVIPFMALSLLASCSENLGTPKPLEECSWEKISQVSKAGKANEWFKVGDTKKLQLKHQDTNNNGIIDDGELYQTVRIIGINEDYTELPTDGSEPNPGKAIGITFEFVDLISDANGYSLATQWNDTNDTSTANHNYLNSSIRYALNKKTGTGGCDHILWAQKGATEWSNEPDGLYTNKSVLDMLPNELTKEGILKTPAKYININNGDGWKEETINDKLFLLSPVEMGRTEHTDEEPHTATYSYYKDAENVDRVKKQIKSDEECTSHGEIQSGKGQTYEKTVYNFAGQNFKSDSTAGGFSWLRSPCTNDNGDAWSVYVDGHLSEAFYVNFRAQAIAPAFCI
ncbi:MAG: DUF6273 domain-containing protein [Bacilli bacterium]|nr:DUF6273 domain-containing protein [Bacilli bacterium]